MSQQAEQNAEMAADEDRAFAERDEAAAVQGSEGAEDTILPPYTDDMDVAQGLACYFSGCRYKGYTWGKLFHHVKTAHKVKAPTIRGTPLHMLGQGEINQQQQERRRKANAEEGGAKAAYRCDADRDVGGRCAGLARKGIRP